MRVEYDVFVSHKNLDSSRERSRDAVLAQEVYDHLARQGLRVFLSLVSLEELGVAAYKKAIDDALDSAQVLVAVGTSAASLESEWVRYEWESFFNDVLSGRKPMGRLFSYVAGVEVNALPRTLRQNQVIVHQPGSQSLLYNFIANALAIQSVPRVAQDRKVGAAVSDGSAITQGRIAPSIATTGEAMSGAAALLETIRRCCERQGTPFSLRISLPLSSSEQVHLICNAITSKMLEFNYGKEVADVVATLVIEMTRNAFEHACQSPNDLIDVGVEITNEYVSLIVENPKGRAFAFSECVSEARRALSANPASRRGRGLIRIAELADSMSATENKCGVKVVVYKQRVKFELDTKDDVVVISIATGLFNPSFERRLLSLASRHLHHHLILDFRGWVGGTKMHTVVIDVRELYANSSKRIVALLPEDDSEAVLPEATIAYSVEEAMEKLKRQDAS